MKRIVLLLALAAMLPTPLAAGCGTEGESAREAVELSVGGALARAERGALLERGVLIGQYAGEGRYPVLLPGPLDAAALQRDFPFVQEVSPLDPEEKLDPALRAGEIPEHAQLGDGMIRLHVQLFGGTEMDAEALLSPLAEAIRYDDESGAWSLEIPQSRVSALADVPEVARVSFPPEPGLL